MPNFYATYGLDYPSHPFSGGWTRIVAPNYSEARRLLNTIHPFDDPSEANCVKLYTEEDFYMTDMPEKGNWGEKEQEVIESKIIATKNAPFAPKTDKDSLRIIAKEIDFLFRNGTPSDEDLDYDNDCIEVYYDLNELKSSLEAVGFNFEN